MKILISFLFVGLITTVSGQEQHVESSSGGQYFFSTGSFTWTVGEVSINTIENPDNHITQGFNQSKIEFLGIEEFTEKLLINVFPNPTTDFININASKKTTLTIYDVNQKQIKQLSLNKQDQVDLTDLSSGTYVLMFSKNNKKLKSVKIIVQK
jgi:hypothetical protein